MTRITNYTVCRGCISQSEGVCAIGEQPCNYVDFTGMSKGDLMSPWLKKRYTITEEPV